MGLARSAPRIAGRLDLARGIIGRLGFRRRRGDDELAPCRGRGQHTQQMHPSGTGSSRVRRLDSIVN